MAMVPRPLTIKRSDPTRVEIEWDSGQRSVFSAGELRGLCPCAACVDELSGVRRHDPRGVAPDLTQVDVRLVGNYAISVRFSDGHSTGIYPFGMLFEHGGTLSEHGGMPFERGGTPFEHGSER